MIDQKTGAWFPDYYGQQPWQDPAYVRASTYPQMNQQVNQQQNQQMMSPPTIHAEIIQIETSDAIDRCAQNPGTTQMYMTKDEQKIIIRTKLANGEHTDVIYNRLPPAPPEPKINPADYVRRDELQAIIEEMIRTEEEKHGTV